MSSSSRKTIIAGNWKMYKTRAQARDLAKAIADGVKGQKGLPEIVLCPPFTSLHDVIAACAGTPVQVGAQNMEYREEGAYTGEISPLMLTDVGAKWVVIGHSERRQYYNESNASVNAKLKAALKHKLLPIVCVGESLDERDANLTDSVVRRQVGAALADLTAAEVGPLVVAYEPVWAIGTGKSCESKEANRVAALIRATISDHFHAQGDTDKVGDHVPVLYGGSVKPSTAEEQLTEPDIDGALVGGASLKAEDFLPIIAAGCKRVSLSGSRK
ncbi:MAG TPA: triose-phosphate isomerase [Planktothrix sp.]|jgi:triosephosphate isomerase